MSIEQVSLALNTTGLDPTTKLVLIGLANHSHRDGSNSYPSVATLAGYVGLSTRSVQYHLRKLEEANLIEITEPASGQKPNTYRLDLEQRGAESAPLAEVKPMTTRGDTQFTPGVKPTALRGEAQFTQNRKEPSDNRQEPIAPSRRDELFETVAETCNIDWHNLTPSARGSLNKAVAQLRGVGATADDVRARAGRWPYSVPLTPPGLAKHWPSLQVIPAGPQVRAVGEGYDMSRWSEETRAFYERNKAVIES